jgi:1-aminocyclopropane-1-carboxylate deaminase/D-cysteine desulfhydrase-like pyridoxal-dependent ACC family enzyme
MEVKITTKGKDMLIEEGSIGSNQYRSCSLFSGRSGFELFKKKQNLKICEAN